MLGVDQIKREPESKTKCSERRDEMGRQPVGDANTQTVAEIWNGRPLQEVRRTHVQCQGVKTYEPCKDCYQPRKTEKVPITVGKKIVMLDQLVGRPAVIGQ